jgi:16S rRNA (uracil1498-N3)-methyltransferase
MPNLLFLPNIIKLEIDQIIEVDTEQFQNEYDFHIGQSLRLGIWPDNFGQGETYIAEVVEYSDFKVSLKVISEFELKSTISISLIVALPRPQILKRILETIPCFSVRNIYLVGGDRVEKSFFQSKVLKENSKELLLKEGSIQAGFSYRPRIVVLEKFRDLFQYLSEEKKSVKLLAEVDDNRSLTSILGTTRTSKESLEFTDFNLAIGPERGWSEREKDTFITNGFKLFGMGPGILRVDVALIAALSRITLLSKEMN